MVAFSPHFSNMNRQKWPPPHLREQYCNQDSIGSKNRIGSRYTWSFFCARVNNVQEPYQASACPVPNATKQSPSRRWSLVLNILATSPEPTQAAARAEPFSKARFNRDNPFFIVAVQRENSFNQASKPSKIVSGVVALGLGD